MRGFHELFVKCMHQFPPEQAQEGVRYWLQNYCPPVQVESNLIQVRCIRSVSLEVSFLYLM